MASSRFPGAELFIPQKRTSLPLLRKASQECRGCDLYLNATQAVFGESGAGGRVASRIFLIGEQPGNEEDKQGRPFVGPAGRVLNDALQQAGIDRDSVYVTNAVKHFKFEERGKRRIHKRPTSTEMNACRPWLGVEIELIKPSVIACLGATAAQTLFGSKFRLTQQRGIPLEHPWAKHVVATVHPSVILRIPDSDERHAEFARLVQDLKTVRNIACD